jgi:hypothetical protein
VKNFKTLSGSSPIFALSNYTTFSQTQTGATVPLRIKTVGTILKSNQNLKLERTLKNY